MNDISSQVVLILVKNYYIFKKKIILISLPFESDFTVFDSFAGKGSWETNTKNHFFEQQDKKKGQDESNKSN